MNVIAEIGSPGDLHAAMRARADQLQLSRLTIDRLANLPAGYASRVLSPARRKGLSDANAFLHAAGARREACLGGR
jgi:hypothetical protein